MTTYTPFRPSNITAPRVTVVLDYQDTTLVVTWNVAAQRYYVNMYTLDGVWVVTTPLVETSRSMLVKSLLYDAPRNRMVGRLVAFMWRPAGQIVDYTLENFSPSTLNGPRQCLRLSANEGDFAYPINQDPGQVTALGSVGRYHNMAAGYFNSTLIYRDGQFETSP